MSTHEAARRGVYGRFHRVRTFRTELHRTDATACTQRRCWKCRVATLLHTSANACTCSYFAGGWDARPSVQNTLQKENVPAPCGPTHSADLTRTGAELGARFTMASSLSASDPELLPPSAGAWAASEITMLAVWAEKQESRVSGPTLPCRCCWIRRSRSRRRSSHAAAISLASEPPPLVPLPALPPRARAKTAAADRGKKRSGRAGYGRGRVTAGPDAPRYRGTMVRARARAGVFVRILTRLLVRACMQRAAQRGRWGHARALKRPGRPRVACVLIALVASLSAAEAFAPTCK